MLQSYRLQVCLSNSCVESCHHKDSNPWRFERESIWVLRGRNTSCRSTNYPLVVVGESTWDGTLYGTWDEARVLVPQVRLGARLDACLPVL